MNKTIHANDIAHEVAHTVARKVAHITSRNPLFGALSSLARAWVAMKDWNNRRIAVRELSAMPDSLLRDIGIERYQIREVVRHGGARSRVHSLRQPSIVAKPTQSVEPVEIKKAA